MADVFVLPSRDENFGMAVVEAMAHSVPTVVTRGVAAHEYVDASGGGVTVGDTADALAEGIRQMLAGDRAKIGTRGRDFVESNLSWLAVGRQIEQLYSDVQRLPKVARGRRFIPCPR